MDRELSAEVIARRRKKIIIRILILIALMVVGFITINSLITQSISRADFVSSIAERGPIEATLNATGIVIPGFEQILTSPIPTTVKQVLKNSGDNIVAGQSIICLDKEFIQLSLNNLEDELALQQNQKKQLSFDLERMHIDLKAQYDIKEMQTQFIASQLDRTRELHKIGGETKEGLDRAELNLEIAQRELIQLQSKIDNQNESLKADLKELDLKIKIQNSKIAEISRQMELADVRAEYDGVVTWVNDNLGATVLAGDVIARVANLQSFKIEATISDIHAGRLRVGGAVRVRIKDVDIDGIINGISPAINDGIVTFYVELGDKSHSSLRSNLRVDVFVVTSVTDGVLRVRNGNFFNGKKEQSVFVIKDNTAYRRILDIGENNYDFVELRGDIQEGDEVIVSDMREFSHLAEITIRKEE